MTLILAMESYDMTSKTHSTKENIGQLDVIKNFCASKDTIKKMKRQPTEWEKIFTKHISDKGLVYRIYKNLTLRNNKTTQFKSRQMISIDISPKKVYKWPISI